MSRSRGAGSARSLLVDVVDTFPMQLGRYTPRQQLARARVYRTLMGHLTFQVR